VFDQILTVVSLSLVALSSAYFFKRRGLRYLQYLQQEDYEGKRFWKWCSEKRAFDRRGTAVAFGAAILCGILTGLSVRAGCASAVLFAILLAYRASLEENPLIEGKVKLKLTERASRIFDAAQSINLLLILCLIGVAVPLMGRLALPFYWFSQVFIFQIAPLILILGKLASDAREKKIQADFADQARKRLKEVNPTVIGITGSYGKTSTKVILSEILNSVGPTFTTPRSINSYMGVTREIRERLMPFHQFAVIEMGAYYIGSIKRMCGLTPPKVAIVTAVGQMHLERFGSVENVFKAKSELAQAIPEDGILICNGDYEFCRRMLKENPKRLGLLYGLNKDAGPLDAYMFDIKTLENGSSFKIQYGSKEYSGFSKLLSKPLLSNALASFTAAVALGVAPEAVLAAIRNVKTESNRLEPVKTNLTGLAPLPVVNGQTKKIDYAAQILRLNDAFNSNPIGFDSALDVLKDIKGNRKILVTPGMIELGERQEAENEACAKHAARICDLVVVVGETNRQPLIKGLKEGGLDDHKIKIQSSMKEALQYLAVDYCDDGDVVLIENDLPDLYESEPRF
jgi:UDP-N-acetylmuramoyl-tripeptide--D-alanyl-D-alanine ligase